MQGVCLDEIGVVETIGSALFTEKPNATTDIPSSTDAEDKCVGDEGIHLPQIRLFHHASCSGV